MGLRKRRRNSLQPPVLDPLELPPRTTYAERMIDVNVSSSSQCTGRACGTVPHSRHPLLTHHFGSRGANTCPLMTTVPAVADGPLPPSRFAAGHTVGGTMNAQAAVAPSRPVATGPQTPLLAVATAVHLPTNKLAITAFVLVVAFGPVGALGAVPIAVVAYRQCVASGRRGAGLAKAAIFIGAAYLVLAVVVVMLRLLTGS